MSRPTHAIPALSAIPASDPEYGAFQEMLFSHPYEAPRGRSSVPLAVMPLWFPVVLPPMETLSLDQVLYRSLASVREPFRRTRLLLSDRARVRTLYTELLDWSVSWAEANLGASLLPVALSLSRLASNGSRLELLTRSSAGAGALLLGILELGTDVPAEPLEDLVAELVTGNAWILIEDDFDGETDLKPVKAALDAVFGASGLSHVAIVLVTARERCDVLSDIQTFSEKESQEAAEPPPRAPALLRPAAGLCRILSRCGSLPMKPALILLALLGLGFLALVVLHQEEIGEVARSFAAAQSGAQAAPRERPRGAIFALALILMPLLGLIGGNLWGVSYGSEEVRAQSVGLLLSSMLLFGALLLVPLPSGMDPGWLKTVCFLLAGLPAAALFAVSSLTAMAVLADVLWLLLSLRICRRLGAAGLGAAAQSYRISLHVAVFHAEARVPHGPGARSGLPLLICARNTGALSGILNRHASVASQLQEMIATGIRRDPRPYSMSVASLALDAAARGETVPTRACLEPLAGDCLDRWLDRDEFERGDGMNGLEYVARRLCYLTNLEELIVVR